MRGISLSTSFHLCLCPTLFLMSCFSSSWLLSHYKYLNFSISPYSFSQESLTHTPLSLAFSLLSSVFQYHQHVRRVRYERRVKWSTLILARRVGKVREDTGGLWTEIAMFVTKLKWNLGLCLFSFSTSTFITRAHPPEGQLTLLSTSAAWPLLFEARTVFHNLISRFKRIITQAIFAFAQLCFRLFLLMDNQKYTVEW